MAKNADNFDPVLPSDCLVHQVRHHVRSTTKVFYAADGETALLWHGYDDVDEIDSDGIIWNVIEG